MESHNPVNSPVLASSVKFSYLIFNEYGVFTSSLIAKILFFASVNIFCLAKI